MFPERFLANGFWLFLLDSAHDPRYFNGYRSDLSRPLGLAQDLFEFTASTGHWLYMNDAYQHWSDRRAIGFDIGEDHAVYETLQEALRSYLMWLLGVRLGRPGQGRWAITHAIWLRTIILIMADIHEDADVLIFYTTDWEPTSGSDADPIERPDATEVRHELAVSEDWSILSTDTFEYMVASLALIDGAAKNHVSGTV